MLETGLALLWAHVLADFVGQTRAMIEAKRRARVFVLHWAIVAATALLALAPASGAGWAALALVVLSHGLIDAGKVFGVSTVWMRQAPFRPLQVFLGDQIAHLVFILIAAAAWPAAFSSGLWPKCLAPSGIDALLVVYVLAAGFWIATRVGELVMALFMGGFHDLWQRAAGAEDPPPADLPRAGAWIGWLERTLVFVFVLLGQFNAIGFVIAAKSILRFQYAQRPQGSEIVIIGTLASFGWAIGVALLTHVVLLELAARAGL
ncbi:DUF3307 domain-containing protein [Salinisphaera sp. SPP-AMP-43]|uniref:DUF3307 domain-containing protein n=1 Tax=Salinisphaera sp. SPP-AMP-43 TaxID=3121288 RepID=UPI003C6E924C